LNIETDGRGTLKKNDDEENIPIRKEQDFKRIPKCSPNDMIIREPNSSFLNESQDKRKKKLSITKLFQNV